MSHKHRLFRNARIIDPASGRDGVGEVLVRKGKIAEVADHIDPPKNTKTTDCRGHVLCPGLIDMRVFIGEPGFENRETIKSAARSAAAGGITTMVMMPDTEPVIDDTALVEFVHSTAKEKARVRVLPSAALTRGMAGEAICEYGLLMKAGAVAFGDGLKTVASAQTMRRALIHARNFDGLVMAAANDETLGSGVMHAGAIATRMGLSGIPAEAEIIPLERDLRLVAMTGAKYHAAALSTAESVVIIKRAKAGKLNVTAAVPVANLALSENDIGPYRTYFRVAPPLRSEDDRMALIEGIRSGVIDIIVSNHHPQDVDSKRLPFAEAAEGAVGLQTLLTASLRLHHTDGIPLLRVLECLTSAPANRLGLRSGRIAVGAPADLTLFDPYAPWVLREDDLMSRARNTPFEGARFEGRVLKTIVGGRTVFSAEPT